MPIPPLTDPTELELSAYHEAGHAAFYFMHGGGVDYVTITGGEYGLGLCCGDPTRFRRLPEVRLHHVAALINLAGHAAEGIVRYGSDRVKVTGCDWPAMGGDDHEHARHHVSRLLSVNGGRFTLARFNWLMDKTAGKTFRLLTDETTRTWQGVEAMARGLLAAPSGELAGEDLRRVWALATRRNRQLPQRSEK